MVVTVLPGRVSGRVRAIASKSHAHRLLICAALSERPTRVLCETSSMDIEATAGCLNALCARIERVPEGYLVTPEPARADATLDCCESGSTYRFLLPVACALGEGARFLLHGRLPARPMEALVQALSAHGARVEGLGTARVSVSGKLSGGRFELPGDISSQFVSGLLFALPRVGGACEIALTSPLASRGYVEMTLEAMREFGLRAQWDEGKQCLLLPDGQTFRSPGSARAQGDWSNAAFFLCAGAICGGTVAIEGLNPASSQGDRAIEGLARAFMAERRGRAIDVSDIPDLAPALALLGAAAAGETRLTNAGRLRLKESDRLEGIATTLNALGGDARVEADELVIRGAGPLAGGRVDSLGDHRIAMMAACAAVLARAPITIERAEAVDKSYPGFFGDLEALGLRVLRA